MIDKSKKTPIYLQIKQEIINNLIKEKIKSGDKVISENQLAKKYNISRLTVRKAYKLLIEENILVSVQGKGTFVSESIHLDRYEIKEKSFKNGKIGIVFPNITSFFSPIINAIEENARKFNLSLIIMFNDTKEKEKEAILNLIEKEVDGIIITPDRRDLTLKNNFIQILEKEKMPFVIVGKPPIYISCNSVYVDDINGAYMAVSYLHSFGHRNILHITDYRGDYEAYLERIIGYEKAMSYFGLERYSKIIDIRQNNWREKLYENLICKDPITAISAIDDAMLVSIKEYLRRKGYKNIALIGYDNTAFEMGLDKNISTIVHPRKKIGEEAFNLLANLISNDDENIKRYKHIILEPELIIRDSIKKREVEKDER